MGTRKGRHKFLVCAFSHTADICRTVSQKFTELSIMETNVGEPGGAPARSVDGGRIWRPQNSRVNI